ncbi:hypothetical protein C2E23DRAFT_552183 [Lenzites betulinus]|nr:hypothetical protein C2E23DRAFT_552183 [Lenzites betulinus]
MELHAFLVLVVAASLQTTARSLSDIPARQSLNIGTSLAPVCSNAKAVTNSTITLGATTVKLAQFSCAPIIRPTDDGLSSDNGPSSLALSPSPLARTITRTRTVTSTRTATSTRTRTATDTTTALRTATTTATATATATETDTATVTAVSVTTDTATETDIETETATETSIQVTTSPTTIVQSVTDTATETDTLITTTATTVIESFTATETATATEIDVTTSATTLIQSTTDTATLTVIDTFTAPIPSPTVNNVCAETCSTVCGQSGGFPPLNEDCARLVDTLNSALTTGTSPLVDVESGHMFTASHGTCRFAFFNFAPTTLETCILSVIRSASAALSGCLETAQPVLISEGLCLASDSLWEVT